MFADPGHLMEEVFLNHQFSPPLNEFQIAGVNHQHTNKFASKQHYPITFLFVLALYDMDVVSIELKYIQ